MPVTGLANLAVKVADLEAACAWYEEAGATVTEPVAWENGRRADVQLGTLALTLFTQAIYEDATALPDEGFLHPALFVDDLDAELARHDVLWGPRTVSGTFGHTPHCLRRGAGRNPPGVHGAARAPSAGLTDGPGGAPLRRARGASSSSSLAASGSGCSTADACLIARRDCNVAFATTAVATNSAAATPKARCSPGSRRSPCGPAVHRWSKSSSSTGSSTNTG